jgi:uncharacterized protein YkwD
MIASARPCHLAAATLAFAFLSAAPSLPASETQDAAPRLPPWLFAVAGSRGQVEEETLSEFARAMLDASNAVRAEVLPAAVPSLPPLSWDEHAAEVAQAWADGCRWKHNSGRSDHYNELAGASVSVGENLYARGRILSPEDIAAGGVNSWASEAADYDYASNSCAAGEECAHYIQLVWRSTTAVGCAVASCPGMIWSTTQYLVCNYVPGARYGGQRPY